MHLQNKEIRKEIFLKTREFRYQAERLKPKTCADIQKEMAVLTRSSVPQSSHNNIITNISFLKHRGLQNGSPQFQKSVRPHDRATYSKACEVR